VSWWLWLIIAWLVISVPFAVITAKFIALGREHAHRSDPEPVIDLAAAEAAEAAEAERAAGDREPRRTATGPTNGPEPAHSN
jgi:hypothetical protein